MNWRPVADRRAIEAHLPEMDRLGISAIPAPAEMEGWTLDECARFGALAAEYDLVVGEAGYWGNLLDPDESVRDHAIGDVREMLVKADAMGARCVMTLAGSFGGEASPFPALSPHPDNWTARARRAVAENCERILDGLDLKTTTYALEPWCNGFYHEPEEVAELLRGVGHPRLRLHLDQMNMHSLATYYRSTEVIERTFELLADLVVAVHAKDLLWHPLKMFLFLEEVVPGNGVLDYPLFLRRLGELPDPDISVFTEHWTTDAEFHEAMLFLRGTAAANDVGILLRRRS
jgi:sugar phosphate isomerase/epimerase